RASRRGARALARVGPPDPRRRGAVPGAPAEPGEAPRARPGAAFAPAPQCRWNAALAARAPDDPDPGRRPRGADHPGPPGERLGGYRGGLGALRGRGRGPLQPPGLPGAPRPG